MPHFTGDISLFSIDSNSVLAAFDNVTLTMTNQTVDTSSLLAAGTRSSKVKASGTIAVNLRSTNGSGETVSHLDTTSLELGAISFTCFRSTGLTINYQKAVDPCVGAAYRVEENTKLNLTGRISVSAVNGTGAALLAPFDKDAAVSVSNATYKLVFAGVTYEFPALIQEVSLTADRDEIQTFEVAIEGRSPNTGAFPTTPTSTTGLLNKALNAFKTALAFSFQSKSGTDGVAVSGNVYFDSVTFAIEDEQLVPVQYTFRNANGWDVAAGS